MEEKTTLVDDHKQVAEYFYQTVRPVVRVLMRFGFSARNANDLLRWAYVKVFFETPEFWREEPSALQCSLKTGVTRAEIQRLTKIDNPRDTQRAERRNRAAHVLFGWITDPDFHSNGRADWLPISSSNGKSFRRLVGRYEADARYQNVLDDLIQVGCIRAEDGGVRLVNSTYGSDEQKEKLAVVGIIARRNGETTDHNLTCDRPDDRFLHRIWGQRNVPAERADEARRELARIGIEAGREMDRYLASISHKERQEDVDYTELGTVIFTYRNHGDDDGNLQPQPMETTEE